MVSSSTLILYVLRIKLVVQGKDQKLSNWYITSSTADVKRKRILGDSLYKYFTLRQLMLL